MAVVTAATPWLLNRYTGDGRSISFQVSEEITTKGGTALSVEVENDGRKVEENVEVWIPYSAGAKPALYLNTEPKLSSSSKTPSLNIDTSIKATAKIDTEIDAAVVTVPKLRSGERMSVDVFALNNGSFIFLHEHSIQRVVSDAVQADKFEPDLMLDMDQVFGYGLSVFVALFLLLAIISYFIPLDSQIESVEKTLADLKAKKEKQNKKLPDIAADTPAESLESSADDVQRPET